ncbi:MAG: glutathione S-transferase N-terminal domain-containing protein [Caulobacteraceae bacterium]
MVEDRIALMGVPGSPYTRKMLALLRYRRIPYRFLVAGGAQAAAMPEPRVRLMPTFFLPGPSGELEAVTDSSPILRRLEREHAGRSVIPADPALAFLDELIEDYADEWLTKAMFHYRWAFAADIAKASQILPLWRNTAMSAEALAQVARTIGERQIGRLRFVGSNEVTGPVIEASYRRFLEAFEAHLSVRPFVLGARPAACDFAVHGQLTQLAQFDPTPMELTARVAPRVTAWVGLMEDLSGLEPQDGDWLDLDALPPTLLTLLADIGRVYPPVMLANAAALAEGRDGIETEVDGHVWTQAPFPYQAKCLTWLRQSHDALAPVAREAVDAVLADTGCLALFA